MKHVPSRSLVVWLETRHYNTVSFKTGTWLARAFESPGEIVLTSRAVSTLSCLAFQAAWPKPCFWLTVLLLKFENSESVIDDRTKCVCYQLSHLIFIKCCTLMCVHIHVSGRSRASYVLGQTLLNCRWFQTPIWLLEMLLWGVYVFTHLLIIRLQWPLISLPLCFLLLLFWCVSSKEKTS